MPGAVPVDGPHSPGLNNMPQMSADPSSNSGSNLCDYYPEIKLLMYKFDLTRTNLLRSVTLKIGGGRWDGFFLTLMSPYNSQYLK